MLFIISLETEISAISLPKEKQSPRILVQEVSGSVDLLSCRCLEVNGLPQEPSKEVYRMMKLFKVFVRYMPQ